MKKKALFKAEIALGVIGSALSLLTFVWPQWIEGIFGIEPDAGSGSLEWAIALSALGVAIVSLLAAWVQKKRMAKA